MNTPLDAWLSWESIEAEQADELLRFLTAGIPTQSAPAFVSASRASLPFYADHTLVRFDFEGDGEAVFALDGKSRILWLDGSSDSIHSVNEAESLALTEDVVLPYVRFFFFFVRAGSNAFVLIESKEDLRIPASDGDSETLQHELEDLRGHVMPPSKPEPDEKGGWTLSATVAYEGLLFQSELSVIPTGMVEMLDDEPLGPLGDIEAPEYPLLEGGPLRIVSGGDSREAGAGDPGSRRDRDVTEALVAVMLVDAVRELDDGPPERATLLSHFNAETRGEGPIDRLRRLAVESVPVIIIESDIPLVEEFVGGLIDGPDQTVSGGVVRRASVVQGDEMRCEIPYGSGARMQLASFHSYRGLYDAERTAHELALGEATVLIGCERAGDVPEPLRRIADLVLTFPRIDPSRFARIFEHVFETPPPSGWDIGGADWTRYLLPTDLHIPKRLGLDAEAALEFLKERVESRLGQVTQDAGPGLSDLHGMGEARQICEDFVVDIRDAQAGKIPWTAVDRGLLLAGPPGTGKTTLARALAKECEIKFVSASASNWQSAGALDAHLRAMRADFSEARRYAPAILFIDEIDSIGSREQVAGDYNAQYHTEVIDAVLELIQGTHERDPVIVIGATNHVERVDPALRRAGRLDQTAELPLPNIPSLEQIWTYHLQDYVAAGQVDEDVDLKALAGLSFGRTGADIEFFARGASRRARRAERKITQEDLVAELTDRPRNPESAPRLTKEELRRVAVHEAGHAVARLLSSSHGEDITFISVIPRTNGALGFVANLPSEQNVMTRREMAETVEIFLAGRAAEEIFFGAEDVGAGAGGSAPNSDLAVANSTATMAVCQWGFGEEDALRWTKEPTQKQESQVRKILADAYDSVLDTLKSHRELVEQVAGVLEERQELSGAELRRLLA